MLLRLARMGDVPDPMAGAQHLIGDHLEWLKVARRCGWILWVPTNPTNTLTLNESEAIDRRR